MESLQTQFSDVDLSYWMNWFAIVSDFILAIVSACFLGLVGYVTYLRRGAPLPPALWFSGIFFGCSTIQHLLNVVLDQSPEGVLGQIQVFAAGIATILLIVTIQWIPTLSSFGQLARQNNDLQRDIVQLRAVELSLHQRLIDLERINAELEYVSRGVVGREERILELKREINQLLQRVGEQPRYRAAMDLPA